MNEKDLAERYLKNINKNVHLNFTLSYRPLQMQRKFLYRQSSGRNVSISFDLTTNDSLNCSGVGAIGIIRSWMGTKGWHRSVDSQSMFSLSSIHLHCWLQQALPVSLLIFTVKFKFIISFIFKSLRNTFLCSSMYSLVGRASQFCVAFIRSLRSS